MSFINSSKTFSVLTSSFSGLIFWEKRNSFDLSSEIPNPSFKFLICSSESLE